MKAAMKEAAERGVRSVRLLQVAEMVCTNHDETFGEKLVVRTRLSAPFPPWQHILLKVQSCSLVTACFTDGCHPPSIANTQWTQLRPRRAAAA
eukprot:scaffold116781_cov48-Phaeocystis_antarctica.AAC.1